MKNNTLHSQIVTAFAWQSASRFVIQIFSWTTTLLVARWLTPNDYGVVAIQGIFTVTIAMVADMGIANGLIQKDHVSDDELSSFFYFSLAWGCAIYVLYYWSAPYIASLYDIEELTAIMRIAGITFILGSLKSVPLAVTMRRMDFRYRSLVELGGSLAHATSLLIMAAMGFGPWSLIISHVLNYLVTAIAYLWILDFMPKPRLIWREISGTLLFSSKLMLNRLMYAAYMKTDMFFLSRHSGEHIVGYYSMATQLANVPLDKIGAIFNEITFPAISRCKGDIAEARAIFLNTHKYLTSIALPILAGLIVIAPDFVRIVLTEKWEPIILPLQLFSGINILRVSGMTMTPTLQGLGYPGKVIRHSIWSLLLFPVSFAYGAQYGIIGIMIAWAVAYGLLYLYLVSLVIDATGSTWRELGATARASGVSVAIMCLLLFLINRVVPFETPSLQRMAFDIIAGATIYVAAHWFFFRRDTDIILAVIRKRLKGEE